MTDAPRAGRATPARRAAHRAQGMSDAADARRPRGHARAARRPRRSTSSSSAAARPARRIARDAALRGLSVALVDAGDFAGQTSSHSSKLIHGGLRYLQYGDLPLVFEGLRERRRLMATAPHLCRPIEFVFPGYRGERPGLRHAGRRHRALQRARALAPARGRAPPRRARRSTRCRPHLRSAGPRRARRSTSTARPTTRAWCWRTSSTPSAAGAAVRQARRASSGSRAIAAGRVRGALGRRRARPAPASRSARACVVNATGPFSDAFDRGRRNLRPTLGVHLVVRRRPPAARRPRAGAALAARQPPLLRPAGRARARSSARPTPTARPRTCPTRPPRVGDEIRARGADVDYLLEAARHAFPAPRLGPDDVVADLRRPAAAAAPARAHAVGDLARARDPPRARRHRRRRGRQADDAAPHGRAGRRRGRRDAARPPASSGHSALRDAHPPAAGRRRRPPDAARPTRRAAADVRATCGDAYGARAARRAGARAPRRPPSAQRIDPELPYLWAEVVHAARHEHAREVADVLVRRVPLFREARDQGLGAARSAPAELIGAVLGWSPDAPRPPASPRYRAAVAARLAAGAAMQRSGEVRCRRRGRAGRRSAGAAADASRRRTRHRPSSG